MKLNANHTKAAGFIGYLTQSLIVNFPPLLFLTFIDTYNVKFSTITSLIAISFTAQLLTDAFAAKFVHKLNIRASVVLAHLLAILGLTGYAYLPAILPPFAGLVIATVLAAVGAGLVEVLISPIVEACPTDGKSAAMSFLHSFYSWGQVAVILLSTLFFKTVGIEHWQILSCLWAIIPAVGAISFAIVPIYKLEGDKNTEETRAIRKTSSYKKLFTVFFILMFCSGAAEMALNQWASAFAENGLGVSKEVGDLLGPCAFAFLMGLARIFHGKFSEKINLVKFILASSVLCTLSYLIAALSPWPIFSLVGCALCGLSAGIMWPGVYSLAAVNMPRISMRTYALLALGGDIGCMLGPTVAGWFAGFFGNDLTPSFLLSCIYPITMIIILICFSKNWNSGKDTKAKKGN